MEGIGWFGSRVSGNFPRVKAEKRARFLVLFVLVDEAANLSSCTSRNPDTRNGKPSHNGKLVYDNDRRRCNHGKGKFLCSNSAPFNTSNALESFRICRSIFDRAYKTVNA